MAFSKLVTPTVGGVQYYVHPEVVVRVLVRDNL